MELDESASPARWAVTAVVTEDFLNHMAEKGIGDGVDGPEIAQSFTLPMMGPLDLEVRTRFVRVAFTMLEENAPRLLASVTAEVTVSAGGDSPLPMLPGPARVRGEVLVDPVVTYGSDGSFSAFLDLPGSELVGVIFEGIDGAEADGDALVQMGEMIFAAVGSDLFASLGDGMGRVGLQLDADDALVFEELGVARDTAEVTVTDGHLTVALGAVEGLTGSAEVEELSGHRLRIGIAAGALTALVNRLLEENVGLPVPFELDVVARDGRIGAQVRNPVLMDLGGLSDLRPALRYTLSPRLTETGVRISLREVWLELPFLPASVRRLNRWVGGMASRAPLNVTLPADTSVPIRPDSDHRMDIRLTGLDVRRDGITLVVDATL